MDGPATRVPRGRGAAGNPAGRFERRWVVPDGGEASAAPLRTTVTPERVRRILTTNDSPDVPFDRSINPYRGCEHGCSYCFARASHAFLGLSPGLDFESRLFSKPDAPERLRAELARPGYRPEQIALGSNTDPYQPVERRLGITRALLEVLLEHRHPVGIVTKSDLLLRDLDLLRPMAAEGLVTVQVSITTLDLELAHRMEPRAPVPARRLRALERLVEAGVPCGVLASPMIPALNDHELESILAASAAAGASWAATIVLRLPHELRELFLAWLDAHYPQRKSKVLRLLREAHGGRLYDSRFDRRGCGSGAWARLLQRRLAVGRSRLGLSGSPPPAVTDRFRVPAAPGRTGRLPF